MEMSNEWTTLTRRILPSLFDADAIINKAKTSIKKAFLPIYSKLNSLSNKENAFKTIDDFIHRNIKLSEFMQFGSVRYVSMFPTKGASYRPLRHQAVNLKEGELIYMCLLLGIIKQRTFLGGETSKDVAITHAKVYLMKPV